MKVGFALKITLSVAFVGSAVTVGYFAGSFAHSMFGPGPETDYSSLPDEPLDMEALMLEYHGLDSESTDYSDVFEPVEAARIAFDLFSSSENHFSQSSGEAVALGLVHQAIHSTHIRQGNDFFEESLSYSGMVKDALRMYQDGDEVVQYRGVTSSDMTSASFEKDGNLYDVDEYVDLMGRTLENPCNYTLDYLSVLDKNEFVTTSFTKNDDDTYSLVLALDPILSVQGYVRQMKTISNLASYPSFDYVDLTFTLGEDLSLISMNTHESYHATLASGIGSAISSTITTNYFTDVVIQIPNVDESVSYSAI